MGGKNGSIPSLTALHKSASKLGKKVRIQKKASFNSPPISYRRGVGLNPENISSGIHISNLDSDLKEHGHDLFSKLDSELQDHVRPNTYLEYEKVRDSAFRQKPSVIIKLRDPIDNHIIAKIRNPKIEIEPYKDPELARLDLDLLIQNGERTANFTAEPAMRYSD